jgi:hypothetical protein
MEEFRDEAVALPALFRTDYEIWVGYHTILLDSARTDVKAEIDDEQLDVIFEREGTRVARMQVKHAPSTAQLMHKAMSQKRTD